MRSLSALIERQIARARASGLLTGLKGEGNPLPDRRVETGEEAATSAGMRMMAEAGVLPEEFRLKNELEEARKVCAACDTDADRKAAMKALADLELRYEIAREARRRFMS